MRSREWKLALSVILIALVTLISFLSSLDNDFVNWDDDLYVTQNILIRDLSWNNIKAIFLSPVVKMYVPLVPLSHHLSHSSNAKAVIMMGIHQRTVPSKID